MIDPINLGWTFQNIFWKDHKSSSDRDLYSLWCILVFLDAHGIAMLSFFTWIEKDIELTEEGVKTGAI